MKRIINRKMQLWAAFLIAILGMGLIFAAFTVPPLGVIHPSVLAAFGEILTFSSSIIGIDYHYHYKSQKWIQKEDSLEERENRP